MFQNYLILFGRDFKEFFEKNREITRSYHGPVFRERVKRLVYRKSGLSIWTYRNSKKSIHLMTSFTISEIDISISICPFFLAKNGHIDMDISIYRYRYVHFRYIHIDMSIFGYGYIGKSIKTYRF